MSRGRPPDSRRGGLMLDAAHDYARRNWPVFPVAEQGKLPKIAAAHPDGDPLRRTCRGECGHDGHGLYDATTDHERIERWWFQWPNANVGLRTGVAFDALDIDGPAGLDTLNGAVPTGDDYSSIDGPTVLTGGGGHHVFVAVTGLGNKAGFIRGCDWRGAAGYVVGVPSVHPSGESYAWFPGCGPDEQAICPAPSWLIALVTPPAHRVTNNAIPTAKSSNYGHAALEREVGRLAMAPVGARNDALNRAACSLGQLVASGALSAAEVISSLVEVARRIGLNEHEIEATIDSGMTAGFRSPRSVA